MKKIQVVQKLREWDKQGRYVFLLQDLAKILEVNNPKTLAEGLGRLVKENVLQRVSRGVYVNPESINVNSYLIEYIAKTMRRGHYNYVSLESILSEYGAISQIPIDRLTVMTTGRKGIYNTMYGTIEFTHTKRTVEDILNNTTIVADRPLRIATKKAAWRDLKRVGRNVNMVNEAEIHD